MLVYDPELSSERSRLERGEQTMQQTIDRIDALIGRPEYDDAVVVGWRVHPDVAETTIESDQGLDSVRQIVASRGSATPPRPRSSADVTSWPATRKSAAPESERFSSVMSLRPTRQLRSVQRGRLGGQREAFLASEFGSVRECAPDRVRRK